MDQEGQVFQHCKRRRLSLSLSVVCIVNLSVTKLTSASNCFTIFKYQNIFLLFEFRKSTYKTGEGFLESVRLRKERREGVKKSFFLRTYFLDGPLTVSTLSFESSSYLKWCF